MSMNTRFRLQCPNSGSYVPFKTLMKSVNVLSLNIHMVYTYRFLLIAFNCTQIFENKEYN